MTDSAPETSASFAALSPEFYAEPDNAWLLLSLLPGMAVNRWHALLDQLGDPLVLLRTSAPELKALGVPPMARKALYAWQGQKTHHPVLQRVRQIRRELDAKAITLITWGDKGYPDALRQIHGPPLVLYIRGQKCLLNKPQIGIVGSRHASRAGLDHARQFARALSEQGYVITSGMAMGVDGAAHQGALEASGPTLAVLGTGVDVVYPDGHRQLAAQIARDGALISEFPPGTPPRANHFPRRNRIISGLSQGVLVVEAGLRSGSLITARLALEQGREVFAIPGSIHNPLARGCHQLIRQGAKLVESVTDIEEELTGWWQPELIESSPQPNGLKMSDLNTQKTVSPEKSVRQTPSPDTDPETLPAHLAEPEQRVLQAVGFDPCSTDTLCEQTGFSADRLMQSLLRLEIDGLIETVPGGVQRLPAP